jgi:hypothetical protein
MAVAVVVPLAMRMVVVFKDVPQMMVYKVVFKDAYHILG